jgi:hypothetical protein
VSGDAYAQFEAAWNAYLCALQGHVWTPTSTTTNLALPSMHGAICSRCGQVFTRSTTTALPHDRRAT